MAGMFDMLGIGNDILSLTMFHKLWLEGEHDYFERYFSASEIEYATSDGKKEPYQHFGGMFSLKESFVKAIGHHELTDLSWKDIEIKHNIKKIQICLHGNWLQLIKDKKVKNIEGSVSYTKDLAFSVVIIEFH